MNNNSKEWVKELFGTVPSLIAGPCSAETEEQVMETATMLKDQGVKVFRAGIWKPRTRPGAFEGVGKKGLPWLQLVQKQLGMKTAVEVANVEHVKEALAYGVDILWIGARTTANPFAVQEIADTLKVACSDIPILIKNPVNPDLNLWLGAVERIKNSGLTKIGCIHRGFSYYGDTEYRNPPHWQIPIELKRLYPNLPIFCDPSHICGNRELLPSVMQTAMDLNMDGIMIEVHSEPDNAWSDAAQQITPALFKQMRDKLKLYNTVGDNKEMLKTLSGLRDMIDMYDNQLLSILQARMKVAKKIGQYKKDNDIVVLQTSRWNTILQRVLLLGKQQGFSEQFVYDIFKAIHLESVSLQDDLMQER